MHTIPVIIGEFSCPALESAGLAARCNTIALVWIRSGCGSVTWGPSTEMLRPHTLLSVGAEQVRIQSEEPVAGYRLEVADEFLKCSFLNSILPPADGFLGRLRQPALHIRFEPRTTCEAEWLLQRMFREDENEPAYVWAALRLLLDQFLLLSRQQWILNQGEREEARHRVSAEAESVVSSLRDYIDRHLNDSLSLKELSDRAGYAPSYFCTLFSRVNGQRLTEYINQRRVSRAQELLRGSNLKIAEICYQAGFNDVAHFNRTFKRVVGITPNQYRQAGLPVQKLAAPNLEWAGASAGACSATPSSAQEFLVAASF